MIINNYKLFIKFLYVNAISIIAAIGLMYYANGCAAFMKGFADGYNAASGNYLTGGPYYDWDIFTNGTEYACRNITNGQFADAYYCDGMPLDDDRWPSY